MTIVRLLIISLIYSPVLAQEAISKDVEEQKANAANAFYQYRGIQPALYNGPQHYGYSPAILNFAYFPTNEWATGSVKYDDLNFAQVLLMYDCYADQLVVKHMYGIAFSPFREKIDEFTIGSLRFIRLDKTLYPNVDPGFYQVAAGGELDFLIRRRKFIKEDIVNDVVQRTFLPRDRYFIRKGSTLIPVFNQKDLVEALADKKKDISGFIRRIGVRFRKDPERVIFQTVQFYNQLSR